MDTHGRDGLSELIYGVGPRILDESPPFWPEDIFGIGPGGQVDLEEPSWHMVAAGGSSRSSAQIPETERHRKLRVRREPPICRLTDEPMGIAGVRVLSTTVAGVARGPGSRPIVKVPRAG